MSRFSVMNRLLLRHAPARACVTSHVAHPGGACKLELQKSTFLFVTHKTRKRNKFSFHGITDAYKRSLVMDSTSIGLKCLKWKLNLSGAYVRSMDMKNGSLGW